MAACFLGASDPEGRVRETADDARPVGADGVIGIENRKLLSEFTVDSVADQAAMRGSLAAQRLSCRDGSASASLIYRNNVVIFSAHELVEDEAKNDHELDDCVFVVTSGKGQSEHYPLLLTTLDLGALASDRGAGRRPEPRKPG